MLFEMKLAVYKLVSADYTALRIPNSLRGRSWNIFPSFGFVCLQVALPELDGGIEPIVFAGRDSNTGKSHSLPDRIDGLCARAIKWAK